MIEASSTGVGQLLGSANQQVFPEPTSIGDRVMIPAAAVDRYAVISGHGGRTLGDGRPVALIEANADGVKVRPVLDLTRIGAVLAVAAVAVWRATR